MFPENRKETTISWWEVTINPLYRTKFCRSQHRDREITCVWRSSPVTMLPTVRRAGMRTDGDGWLLHPQNYQNQLKQPTSS